MATISGMFGNGATYFCDSPVVIHVGGLEWPNSGSPFTVVRVEVIYGGSVVGEFRADTGGQTSISFDISSACRAIWADYDFDDEIAAANACKDWRRGYRGYSIRVYTEYLDSKDGAFVSTTSGAFSGGSCAIGRHTEWERAYFGGEADVSAKEHSNPYNGDASTKPTSSPERVGRDSITSWVDVSSGGTSSAFLAPSDTHVPVLRDSIPYQDFLFVNRRGAVETCSGRTLEAEDIEVNTTQYSRVERPSFVPKRSLMAIARDGRRSWSISSGHVDRAWAEWWALEFLPARRWWMKYQGRYVPVIVTPAKKSTAIYDRTKQQMPHVDFTVTLALEG